jgi:hypothetical protein
MVFIELLWFVSTSYSNSLAVLHALHITTAYASSLLQHSLPRGGSQRRRFISCRVSRFRSSLAGVYIRITTICQELFYQLTLTQDWRHCFPSPIGYRGGLLSSLLQVNVYVTHNFLNVLVQNANKMGFKKIIPSPGLRRKHLVTCCLLGWCVATASQFRPSANMRQHIYNHSYFSATLQTIEISVFDSFKGRIFVISPRRTAMHYRPFSLQSQSYITAYGQLTSLYWCQAPIWDPRPI